MSESASIFQSQTFNDDYIKNVLKQVSWVPSDDFVMFDNQDDFALTTRIDKELEDALKTKGTTKASADTGQRGIWRKYTNTENNTEIEHAFNLIYKKLACCLGKTIDKPLVVPILKNYTKDSSGKITNIDTQDFQIAYDTSGSQCTINGVNYKDENNNGTTMNDNCLKLVKQLVAFLNKYDPLNPLLTTVGACVNNALIPPQILRNATLTGEITGNRECSIKECQNEKSNHNAFLTQSERTPCQNKICIAKLASDSSSGTGNVNAILNNNSITLNCGDSDLEAIAAKAKSTASTNNATNSASAPTNNATVPDPKPSVLSTLMGSLSGGRISTDDTTTSTSSTLAVSENLIDGVDDMILVGSATLLCLFLFSSSILVLSG